MIICLIYSGFFMFFSLMSFIFSVYFIMSKLVYFFEITFFSLNSINIEMTILFDWMSLMFMSFVLFISSMVIFYSKSYMEMEKDLNRFILLVVLFVISMMLLIISPNLISILLGWDGLGLVSYCLVIYYQNIKSYNAGMLTVLSNRIGDVMILISIAWMLNFGSWNYIFYLNLSNSLELKFIGLLIIIAAMTKSAQIPFSSWLPAAMAAPTPVSALVHSSTLVTAGIYLLIRFHEILGSYLKLILFIGLMTMFMSGLGANFEFDLKKIIALSTLSQLGFMMTILGMGEEILAFYHLLVHALFKALLFMCAGSIIHNFLNCQDIRFMGSISEKMPLSMVFFNVSNLSLCGFPFLSGFYSKDVIAEFFSMNYLNLFIFFLFYFSIGLTVSYSFRLTYYSLVGYFNFFSLNNLEESSDIMKKSMGSMFVMVLFSGSMLNWLMFDVPYVVILPFIFKILTLLMVLVGMFMGFEISKLKINFKLFFYNKIYLLSFLSLMWNMPFLSTLGINYFFISSGKKFIQYLDQGWFEYLGSQNLYNNIKTYSKNFQYFYMNNLKTYLILIICWILIILVFIF
uniref:NADH-ubiquinone oxidoreductase chain 5 n=1 Tax=Thalassa montezumae TaxID=3129753 RepID=A0AAU7LK42_9CUCU